MKCRPTLSFVCATLALAWLPQGHAKKPKETDAIEQKIKLMGEVFLARDRGDFETAQTLVDQLLQQGGQDSQLLQLKKTLKDQAVRHAESLKAAQIAAAQPPPLADPVEDAKGGAGQTALVLAALPPTTVQANTANPVPSQATQPPRQAAPVVIAPLTSQQAMQAGTTDVESLMRLETARQQGLLISSQARLAHSQQLANEGRHAEALSELNGLSDSLPYNPMTQSVHQQAAALRIDLEHRLAVADLTPGAEPPRLSMTQEPAAEHAARMDVELQLIELPVEVVDDLWKAWVFFAEQTIQGQKDRMVLDSKGRQVFLRQANRIPTQRQQLFIWAFQMAKARPGSGAPLQIREGVSGLVAELDPEPIIKALSGLEGCRVLGSPRFATASGQKTMLGFTPEVEARANLMEGPRRVAETRIGWQVEVRPELRNSDHSVSFEISPRVNRYEGFVVSPDGFSMPAEGPTGPSQSVHSSHELRTQVEVPLGATLMLAGLTWDEGAPHRLKTGVIRQLPLIGHYVQLKETAGRQTELLVFVRAKKP